MSAPAIATEPRSRGILFKAEMVRAILAGRKTQTRRVIKETPPFVRVTDGPGFTIFTPPGLMSIRGHTAAGEFGEWFVRPTYGAPGDLLWVRETWCCEAFTSRNLHTDKPVHQAFVRYKSDGLGRSIYLDHEEPAGNLRADGGIAWRPSLLMPRWASRITLRITDVRVQRVQEINEEDALAEGVGLAPEGTFDSARDEYAALWDSMHGKDAALSWDGNPFVWCVSFERVI